MPIYRYNPGYLRERSALVLLALNLALGIADGFSQNMISRAFWARGFDVYAGQYWRILSAGFAHLDVTHLLMNSYSLWVLGKVVEPLFGTKRFVIIYFVALLGGSALSLTLSDPNLAMLGASGAIFGLFGALLGYLFSRTGSWQGVWNTSYGRQLIIVLMINAGISLMPGISLLGHLGGFVPGLFLGIYYERASRRDVSFYDRASLWVVLGLVAALCIYSCAALNKPGFIAIRALKAYEAGDFEGGDELRQRAASTDSGKHEGVSKMLEHLRAWRLRQKLDGNRFGIEQLRWPLSHIVLDWPAEFDAESQESPYHFLIMTPALREAEADSAKPASPAKNQ